MRRLRVKRIIYFLLFLLLVFYIYNFLTSLWMKSIEEEDIAKIIKFHEKDPAILLPRLYSHDISDEKKIKNTNSKKDWHDNALIYSELQRLGPGEQGKGVVLSVVEKNQGQYQQFLGQNGFNALASDKISLERSLNDIRHPLCRKKLYLRNLPSVSIVIPFHDEHLTTLLRSVHSIVKRTPPELLVEIILVDDFSTKKFLGEELEEHIRKNFKAGLVKVIRNKAREGLIRTRMAGADIAKGEVIVFFDSHIECNVNWLPPLIEPIAEDKKTSVCPFIDVISEDTFEYRAQDEGARGAFDWELYYKRLPRLAESNEKPTEPFDNPVMAGGLFAINREWFYQLGGYDKGLEVWGGEQYELSFKIWQCGGKIVDAPCSRVGHVYRRFNPFSVFSKGDYLSKNYRRVAETWMDEYKEVIYKKRPHMKNIDYGDISEQLKIKKELNCKPFKWFMEKVAFDLVKHYPTEPIPPYASGQILNIASNLCMEDLAGKIGLNACKMKKPMSQQFEMSFKSDLKFKSRMDCFDVPTNEIGDPITLFACHGLQGNQGFKYNLKTSHIYHVSTRHCVDSNDKKEVFMNTCLLDKSSQQWKFDVVNRTLLIRDFSEDFLHLQ